jgi:uncharacterized membrane protein
MTVGENNWLSAIFMGLAVASKQTAWFFLPFYLILMWQTSKPKDVAMTLGVVAGLFAVLNGYFIWKNPLLWLDSIAAPMAQPMFPLGVGIITLVTSGIVNIHSSLPFTAIELLAIIGAVVWYARNCRKYPDAGPLLSVLPLFLAWRSLWTYFFYIDIIIMARMLLTSETKTPVPSPAAIGRT